MKEIFLNEELPSVNIGSTGTLLEGNAPKDVLPGEELLGIIGFASS